MKKLEISGFTLAEVLITLVIIGIISAITVPILINKTQNQEYVSKLKKAYSTLSQVTNIIISEEGTPRADKGGWASSTTNVYNMYKKYLINAKECKNGTNCWNSGFIKNLNNSENGSSNYDSYSFPKLILADGTLLIFWAVSPDCSSGGGGYGMYKFCSIIIIDVNGEKKPNKWGRDNFQFLLTEKRLIPRGCGENGTSEGCPGVGGHGCACKVLREGAMNY